jgi:small-conductance mechanosensitive channel
MSVQRPLGEWLEALGRPSALAELGVLALCLGLSWSLVRLARRGDPGSIWFGRRGFDGALFPLLAFGLALTARWALSSWKMPIAVFDLAVPILASLAMIRVTVRVLQAAVPEAQWVRTLERTVSWLVWIGLVLWFTGLMSLMLDEMEQIHWRIGGANVSLRSMVEGAVTAVVVMVLVLWLSATLESRLLAGGGSSLSVRKMAANATRAILLLVGLLLALSAAGIPLGALSVMGGAIGVGIGLGLQKLAANYVSGFVILAEHSLRIGDVVKVDTFEGQITDIKMRYTVIRAVNGRESIVPNELLVTNRIENCSFADPKVALSTTVQVAYATDLAALMPRLGAAVKAVPRVIADPAPSVQLSQFAADGLELTIVFWIADSDKGTGNVRSEVNLALLAAITAAGVEIPFPQQVVHAAPGSDEVPAAARHRRAPPAGS